MVTSAAKKLQTINGLASPNLIASGITNRQMAKLLKQAAARAEALIQANAVRLGSLSGQVTQAQLRIAQQGLSRISTDLWNEVGKITQAGMYQAGSLAADQALDLDLLMGMPGKGLLQMADVIHFEAAQSVEDVISRRTAGHALSDKIYVNGKHSTAQVGNIIEQNLLLQRSAKDIAREVRSFFDPAVPGGASFAAMRVGRTEINNAHHETTKRLAKDKPWVLGMKWNLSGSHPRPDACNDYAAHEEGLGAGGWADAPSKPHPMCLCYLTHLTVDEDQFMDGLVQGDYDDYLQEKGVSC